MFCIKCGDKTRILHNNLCESCFKRNIKLIESLNVIYLKMCPLCGSFFIKGKWISNYDEIEIIKNFVKSNLEVNKEIPNINLNISLTKPDVSRYFAHIDAEVNLHGIEISDSANLEIRINKESCKTCSRISGGYFEAIIQIRAENRIPTKKEIQECLKISEKISYNAQENGDRLAFISKTVKQHEGIDIYVGTSNLAKKICKTIINTYGGKIIESPKLAGKKDGVNQYRITFSLKLPEFVKGDILMLDDKIIQVQSYGKYISGIDIETGKKYVKKHEKNIKRIAKKEDILTTMIVSYEKNTVQILDPETYETTTLKKPEFFNIKSGDYVKVLKTEKGIYLINQK